MQSCFCRRSNTGCALTFSSSVTLQKDGPKINPSPFPICPLFRFEAKELIKLSTGGDLYFDVFSESDRSTDKIMSQEYGIVGFLITRKLNRNSVSLDPDSVVMLTGNVYLRHPSFFERMISDVTVRRFYEVAIEKKQYLLNFEYLKELVAPLCNAALPR